MLISDGDDDDGDDVDHGDGACSAGLDVLLCRQTTTSASPAVPLPKWEVAPMYSLRLYRLRLATIFGPRTVPRCQLETERERERNNERWRSTSAYRDSLSRSSG